MNEYIGFISNMNEVCIDENQPIVRCCDCIYYKPDPDPGWPMMCERTGDYMVEPYGFCAWGERKKKGKGNDGE